MTSSSTSSTRKSTEKTTTASTISVSPTSTGTSIDFTDTASKTTTETTRFKPFIIIGGSGIGDVGGRYARLDAVIDRDYSEVVASAEAGEAIAQGIESELHAADIRVWKIAIVEGSVVAQIKLSATDEPKAKALFKGCDVCIPLSDGTTVCPHLAGETSCDDTGTMLEGAESNDPGDTNASASGAAAGGAAAAAVAVAAIAFIAVRRRRADARDERDDVEAAMKLPQSFEKGPETLELPPRSAGCTMESHQYEYETPVADDNSVPLYEEPGSPDEEYSGVALDDSAQHGTCNYEDECNYAMAGGVEEEATYDFAKDNYKIDAVPEYGTASAEASPRDGAVDYAIAGGIAAIRRVSTELQDQMNSEPHYETATSFATLRREDPPDYAVAEDIKSSGRQSLLLDQEPGCEPTYDVAA